jgi:hypothetical protein
MRLSALEKAKTDLDNLPLCNDDEMWSEPDKYAVYKGDNKRASRVFELETDADNFVNASKTKDMKIVKRKGDRRKCREYCLAAPFCSQWQTFLKETTEAEGED